MVVILRVKLVVTASVYFFKLVQYKMNKLRIPPILIGKILRLVEFFYKNNLRLA